jgi:hypothetical protein
MKEQFCQSLFKVVLLLTGMTCVVKREVSSKCNSEITCA